MAWVRAATASNNNQTSSISAFFVPYPPLLSGTDYYVQKEGLNVGNNTLYIENTSPRLALVTDLYSGLYELPFQQSLTYLDFRLFPNLVTFHGAGNNTLFEADLRENASLYNFYTWTGGISGIRVIGLQNLFSLDIRNGSYQYVNLSGTKLSYLNLDSSYLSAFKFNNCSLFSLDIGRTPLKVLDFTLSDTRALSGIASLNLGPHNIYSNYTSRLSSFNFTGPLSSLRYLFCNNNQLTSFVLQNIPTLSYLHLGDRRGYDPITYYNLGLTNGNLITDPVLINLPALQYLYLNTNPLTSLNVTGLTALQYLDVGGYNYFSSPVGSLSSLNIIIGLSALSALETLDVSCNPITEINFNNYPSSFKLRNLSALNCSLTSLNLDNLADSLTALNLFNSQSLSSLDISSLSALKFLDLGATSNLRSLILPAIPNNLENIAFTNSRFITSFNYNTLNNLISLTLNSYSLSSVQLAGLSALKYFNCRTSAPEIDLTKGLSSIDTLVFTGNVHLSAVKTENNYFASLTSITFDSFFFTRYNNSLSAFTLTGAPVLKTIYMDGSPLKNINIKNNPQLNYFYFLSIQSSNKFVDFSNCYNLNQIYYYGPINSIDFTNCTVLSSIFLYYTNLTSLPTLPGTMERINVYYHNISSINFSNYPVLNYLVFGGGDANSITLSNLPNLAYLSLNNNGLTSFDFTGSVNLSSVNISNNRLREINNFTVLHKCSGITEFTANTNQLSSINLSAFSSLIYFQAFTNYLSTINLNYSKNITNLQIQDNNISTLDLTPLTGLEYIHCEYNNLTSINVLTSTKISYEAYVNNNLLDSESIDALFYSLCAGGAYIYDYTNNKTGRSSYSNQQYTHMSTQGVVLYPDEPNNTVSQPVPKISIVQPSLPATLQYTQTLDLSATASYLGNRLQTFYTVLSGPGKTLSPTVSALSGTGTITVLVSSLSTTVFAPATALFDITLTRLDISNFIQFTNTSFVYTGSPKSVSAFSPSYPGVGLLTYYLSSGSFVTPIETGSYTVSAVSVNGNYSGSATTTMTIYPTGFYTLPVSAKSTLIYSTSGFDTRKDIVITFDYAFYGSTTQAGEGFCVSLIGYTPIVSGGAPGYGLNYTNANYLSTNSTGGAAFINYNGLYSGILGIGFDSTGNFGTSSYGVTGLPTSVSNSITLRGGFYDNYQVITRTNSLSSFDNPISIYQQITGTDLPVYRRIRIRFCDLGKRVIVQQKELSARDFSTYLDYNFGDLTPNAVRPCLSYSSGLTAATLKIKNFNINGYFNNDYSTPVEPTTFDSSIQIPISGGVVGYYGVSFASLYQSDILSYDNKYPTDLPLTMDIYINNAFVATVNFDPIYLGQKFTYFKFNTQTNYEGIFAPGSVQVL